MHQREGKRNRMRRVRREREREMKLEMLKELPVVSRGRGRK
jgi:hypothetical protein